MYFINRDKALCHILEDMNDGKAPCGACADQLDLISLWAGRQTPHIMAERPAGVPLCQHCEQFAPASSNAD